jgi:alcohol dehydrogenase class IV
VRMTTHVGVLRLPGEVRFGRGALAAVPALTLALGRRVCVVADPFLAATKPFREAVEALEEGGATVLVVADVPAELPVAAVESAGSQARAFAPEVVVGYGGGSALDAAKLVALLVTHDAPLSKYYGENEVPGPVSPLVAVPTTSGTGSEVTPVAVVSDPARALKVGISSPYLIPRVAVVDPELSIGAPRAVTAFAGIDAFVHAVESLTAADLGLTHRDSLPVFVGRNALSRSLSLEAARVLFHALPRVLENGDDMDSREDMAYGSLLAGMAFGSTGTHLSHAIQYPIGALTHTPHGLGTGALLPYVLEACLPATFTTLAQLGGALGIGVEADTEAARAALVVDAIAELCAKAGAPVALSEIGIDAGDRERVVERTLEVRRLLAIAPVPADAELIRRIVDAAIAGDRRRLSPVTSHPTLGNRGER